jgi:nitrous oxide reductase accessory protein NosL
LSRAKPSIRATALAAFLGAFVLAGCPSGDTESDLERSKGPLSLANTEGAVCGMVVSEQPAPRAQVVHRDGTRLYLCGIADLLVHLEAPSPHGIPADIYVELMEADEDPREISFAEHEWIRAERALYRIGDERPRLIMGVPIMVYRDRPTAEAAIAHGPTEILDWGELQAWWRRPQS